MFTVNTIGGQKTARNCAKQICPTSDQFLDSSCNNHLLWGNKIYNDTENLGCRVISCCVRSMKERTKNIRGSDEMEKIRTQKVITFKFYHSPINIRETFIFVIHFYDLVSKIVCVFKSSGFETWA